MYKKYQEAVKEARSRQGTPKPNENKKTTPAVEDAKNKRKNSEWKPLERHKSTWGKDAMISYSHQNRPFMRKLKGKDSMILK